MSIEKARAWLDRFGLGDRIREFEVSSATVELAAAALTVGLHLWRRNPLLSIAAGTALYMTLVA